MLMRVVVSRCAKAAAVAVAANTRHARRVVALPTTQITHSMRLSTSSRFLSLADEEGSDKKRRGGDGEDGEDGEGDDEEGLEAAEGVVVEGDAEAGEKDGDLELEELEMYKFCVTETESVDDEIMELHLSNPLQWTSVRLARKFGMSKQRVEATIFLQAESAGLSHEELLAKIEEAKVAAAQHEKDESAKLASAEARGDEKEVKRLQKRERQEHRAVQEVDDEELTAEEEAFVLGIDDERYRNPDFFFLSDEFDGLPPLTRRLGKHKATDKLYPEEALEIQRLATKNKVVEHKSFAKPTDKKSRWKFAVKDTTKTKLPLYIRDNDHQLRLATKEEVLPRSWVRRPAFFAGLNPSDN